MAYAMHAYCASGGAIMPIPSATHGTQPHTAYQLKDVGLASALISLDCMIYYPEQSPTLPESERTVRKPPLLVDRI